MYNRNMRVLAAFVALFRKKIASLIFFTEPTIIHI